MQVKLEEIIERIISVNHAWKLSREEFGNEFAATQSLRHTKSSLQATLLREFPHDAYLVKATDSDTQDEDMYSVRLETPILINGFERYDAEHLPVRVADEILTKQEITKFLKK
ncbi:hypothetical protein ACUOEB_002196 [Vibrio vulnificus]|uniref:hypothetical protein n=1 Tax=Vibrio vulnificus TaxID=672 RepID=UPI000CD2FE5E|nr:hypothetical protein [Vibrio vulnificus]EHZ7121187.1 hypothetical protein [Vibrio vulnificus]ELO5515129.1 hypothetical protein [Vibrio vulnificus]MCU8357882.1 hypothetical protein [Vibrio vulnificus]POB89909.1 hypothetical protein CRN40_02235 [Vibrio vulnificus]HAS8248075.1 hypothetical protein [Vibrio vulnificus]